MTKAVQAHINNRINFIGCFPLFNNMSLAKIMMAYIVTAAVLIGSQWHYPGAPLGVQALIMTTSSSSSSSNSMWHILGTPQPHAWRIIFGAQGERGEYMDAYAPSAMIQRCQEDYQWDNHNTDLAAERASMMSHLYDKPDLWNTVCMVAFAEHYILTPTNDNNKNHNDSGALSTPFHTFRRHQTSQQMREQPRIFGGVVWSDWESYCDDQEKIETFKNRGIDYVRLECNFGTVQDIGRPIELARNPLLRERFHRLAEAAKACQNHEMVPLLLLQVPWRESGGEDCSSKDYFEQALQCLANALNIAKVEPNRLLLETRPPVGMSAQEERDLSGVDRKSLGFKIGQTMFEVIEKSFSGDTIAGFCVAGGSTKGDNPTAMEDDTQNAVRQGIRQSALKKWNFELCFWEMGAKLMLQPKIGRLWGSNGQAGRDAAREIFRVNAKDLANEIKKGLQ